MLLYILILVVQPTTSVAYSYITPITSVTHDGMNPHLAHDRYLDTYWTCQRTPTCSLHYDFGRYIDVQLCRFYVHPITPAFPSTVNVTFSGRSDYEQQACVQPIPGWHNVLLSPIIAQFVDFNITSSWDTGRAHIGEIEYYTNISDNKFPPGYSTTCPLTGLPVLRFESANYGPVAGGTHIVLLWNGTDISRNISIYIGDQPCLSVTSNDIGQINCITPPYQNGTAIVYENVPVALLSEIGTISSVDDFQYRPNPWIENIFPDRGIVSGGTLLTVTGLYLDSVAEPQMLVTAYYAGDDTKQEWNLTQACYVANSSMMYCPLPNLTSIFNATFETTNLFVDIGFYLDGEKSYQSNVHTVEIFPDPEIDEFGVITYYIGDKKLVEAKGKYMMSGCREEDYIIRIGEGYGEMVGLSDNRIFFRPPAQLPPASPVDEDDSSLRTVVFEVGVDFRTYAGSLDYQAYVDYTPLWIVLGVVGGICVAGISIMCVHQCRHKSKKMTAKQKDRERAYRLTKEQQGGNNNTSDSADSLVTDAELLTIAGMIKLEIMKAIAIRVMAISDALVNQIEEDNKAATVNYNLLNHWSGLPGNGTHAKLLSVFEKAQKNKIPVPQEVIRLLQQTINKQK